MVKKRKSNTLGGTSSTATSKGGSSKGTNSTEENLDCVKKQKISKIDQTEWVSATKIRNWVLEDTLLDWLDLYGKELGYLPSSMQKNYKKELDLELFLISKGEKFENKVLEYIYNKFPLEGTIRQISQNDMIDSVRIEKFEETIQAMKEQVPIIVHGVLHNSINKTFGCPDLIVRVDYINKIADSKIVSSREQKLPISIGNKKYKYHYRIIDIKFTTLNLLSNGKDLSRSRDNRIYKIQLEIYNRALELIQGYHAPKGYIIGRKWKYLKNGKQYVGNDCFSKFGEVNLESQEGTCITVGNKVATPFGATSFGASPKGGSKDSEIAVEWIRRLRRDGEEWDPYNPCEIIEMFPNMSNYKDIKWHEEKKILANFLKEITIIYGCSPKNRKFANDLGFDNWKECTIKSLGINEEYKISSTVESILEINKQELKEDKYGKYYESVVLPEKIVCDQSDKTSWHIERPDSVDFFVDFETVTDIDDTFEKFPQCGGINMIFTIGCGYVNKSTGEFTFKNFIAKTLDHSEEKKIIIEWIDYMNKICKKNRIFHWSSAEISFIKNAATSTEESQTENEFKKIINNLIWFDLRKLFLDNNIVILGCFDFKLKNVATAMFKNGLIQTSWDSKSIISNGLGAMIAAFMHYKYINSPEGTTNNYLSEILKYNQIDCRVLFEILEYLRIYHT